MVLEIKGIRLGFVNCYLVKIDSGFILIDTGLASQRANLERELAGAGCKPGNLKLILITHGDSDHSGNGAYLRERFGAKIAMHRNEAEMVAGGNMLSSRKVGQSLLTKILVRLINPFFALRKPDRFKADIEVEDGYDLSVWGFEAKVVHIPGHSSGSIGVLTTAGDLFCGDLIDNYGKPRLHIIDDMAEANASVEKLNGWAIKTVYPGHGGSFSMEQFSTLAGN